MKNKKTQLKEVIFGNIGLICLVLFSCNFIKAQDNVFWKPVTPAEMDLKSSLVEKDADAEALFWEVRLDDSKISKLAAEHYVRVKIFTERGREKFSKFDIPFVKGKKVENVAARVIKPDGKIINLRPEDVFEREIYKNENLKIKAKSFAVSGIEPGVILEYKYREVFKGDSLNNERLVFQRDIPIQRISYYLRGGENLTLKSLFYNSPPGVRFIQDVDKFSVVTMNNVPAFKEEPRMPPDEEVRSWALVYYESFIFSPRWDSYMSRISSGFIKFLTVKGEVPKKAKELTQGLSTPEEKIKKIYDFVQSEIKNVSYDSSMTEAQLQKFENKDANETLKRKMGNLIHIEQLFASMLFALGFDVRIAYAGDRSEKFFNPNTDNHYSFMHPCCIAVAVEGKWKYFNPGVPYLPFGKLLWKEELVYTALVGDNTHTLDSTPLSDYNSSAAKRKGNFKLLEDGTLEGSFSIEFNGHLAIGRRQTVFENELKTLEDGFKESLKNKVPTLELSEFKIENVYENSKPLVYSGKIKVPGYAQKTGKRMFLQPGFFEYGETPEFTSNNRQNPLYFSFPWSEDDDVEISLPENFILEVPDAPAPVADPAKIGSLEIKIYDKKTAINYKRKFHFGGGGNLSFPVNAYQPLKKLFDSFHKADTHVLTLKQK